MSDEPKRVDTRFRRERAERVYRHARDRRRADADRIGDRVHSNLRLIAYQPTRPELQHIHKMAISVPSDF